MAESLSSRPIFQRVCTHFYAVSTLLMLLKRCCKIPLCLKFKIRLQLLLYSQVHFTARRYASAVYAVIVCLSVCPSVRHTPVLYPKRLNIASRKQRHTIAQGLQFSDVKNIGEILTGSPPTGTPCRSEVGSTWRFSTYISLYLRLRYETMRYCIFTCVQNLTQWPA